MLFSAAPAIQRSRVLSSAMVRREIYVGRSATSVTLAGTVVCQRIVKNHGGTISVQSKVAEGSTFTIRLPALVDEALPSETPPVEPGTPMPALPATQIVPVGGCGSSAHHPG
jgi:hypothetical protein